MDTTTTTTKPKLEIKSWRGAVLAATEEYDTLTAWARSGDLSGANLSGADLSGADLSGAYLSRANLSGANLSGADLSGADLSGAYLSRAYLNRAYLSRAYLNRAYLNGANLSGAYLNGAYLNGAYLNGANLSGAYLNGANLSRADLSGVEAVIDGGQDQRGWRMTGWLHDGQLMIKARCHNFTLAEARAHWGGADYLNDHDAATQAEMKARLKLVVAVARARRWKFSE